MNNRNQNNRIDKENVTNEQRIVTTKRNRCKALPIQNKG